MTSKESLKKKRALWITHAIWLIEDYSKTPDEPGFRKTIDVVNEELKAAQDALREIEEELACVNQ